MSYPPAHRLATAWCTRCQKWTYLTRRDARKARRDIHPGEHIPAYPCPIGSGWHIGHPPPNVISGRLGQRWRGPALRTGPGGPAGPADG